MDVACTIWDSEDPRKGLWTARSALEFRMHRILSKYSGLPVKRQAGTSTGAFMSKAKTKIPNGTQDTVRTPSESGPASPAVAPVNEHEVANLAYQRWVARGCPMGQPEEDWFEAEHELQSGQRSA
jgi:hypothetical protein